MFSNTLHNSTVRVMYYNPHVHGEKRILNMTLSFLVVDSICFSDKATFIVHGILMRLYSRSYFIIGFYKIPIRAKYVTSVTVLF